MFPVVRLALAIQLGPDASAVGVEDTVQAPPVETMVEALSRGHLVIDQARFKPADDQLVDGVEPVLRQTARALSRTEGRYLVFVPFERDPRFPPDTVLSRRRALTAFRRLIAAGSNPNRLAESRGMPTQSRFLIESVAPGQARIELLKIE